MRRETIVIAVGTTVGLLGLLIVAVSSGLIGKRAVEKPSPELVQPEQPEPGQGEPGQAQPELVQAITPAAFVARMHEIEGWEQTSLQKKAAIAALEKSRIEGSGRVTGVEPSSPGVAVVILRCEGTAPEPSDVSVGFLLEETMALALNIGHQVRFRGRIKKDAFWNWRGIDVCLTDVQYEVVR